MYLTTFSVALEVLVNFLPKDTVSPQRINFSIPKASDDFIHIDMYGQNSSMNVVQAANIALYEITKQLL